MVIWAMSEPRMDDLYDEDVLAWSERQAGLLRRFAAGENVNARPDWDHIIEEIEDVGSERLHAVESLLVQALVHLLKLQAWPEARDAEHWDGEARGFRDDAAARFTPSMRQKIDVGRLYARALRRLPRTIDGQSPLALPQTCPWTLDGLLGED